MLLIDTHWRRIEMFRNVQRLVQMNFSFTSEEYYRKIFISETFSTEMKNVFNAKSFPSRDYIIIGVNMN